MTKQLTPGEHVDLDSGIIVRRYPDRKNSDPGTFAVSQDRPNGRRDTVHIDRDDIKTLATLAGLVGYDLGGGHDE